MHGGWPRLLAVWCLLLACVWRADAAPRPVLIVTSLPEAVDAPLLHALRAEFAAARIAVELQTVQFSLEGTQAERAEIVGRALRQRPWELIVTTTENAAWLVLTQEHKVPVLFRTASNPSKSCLVESLRRPGGNATGYSSELPSEPKMVELLRLAYPTLDEIVLLADGGSRLLARCDAPEGGEPTAFNVSSAPCRPGFWDPEGGEDWREHGERVADYRSLARRQAGQHGRFRVLRLCGPDDVQNLSHWLPARGRVGVILPMSDLFFEAQTQTLAALRQLRVPAITSAPWFAGRGVVMFLNNVPSPSGRPRGVELAPRLLGGDNPGEIPVMFPEGFELTIDLAAAQAVGALPSRPALRAADRLKR